MEIEEELVFKKQRQKYVTQANSQRWGWGI